MPPRYDHRDVWWGGVVRVRVLLCGVVGGCGPPAPRPLRLFVPGVGGGLVVVCIVDAGLCSVRGPPWCGGGVVFPLLFRPPPWFPWCGGWGWGCVFVLAC